MGVAQDAVEGARLEAELAACPLARLACAVCRAGWACVAEAEKRPIAELASLLALLLHPLLFARTPLHAPRRGPLRVLARRLMRAGTGQGRVMRCCAAALWTLWLAHPDVALRAGYLGCEAPLLCLYAPLDGPDCDYGEEMVEAGARAAVAAMPGGDALQGAAHLAGETLAVRAMAVCAASQLATRGDPGLSNGGCSHCRAAGRQLMLALLGRCVPGAPQPAGLCDALQQLSSEPYRRASPAHRRKVRAWQTLMALSPLLPTGGEAEAEARFAAQVDGSLWEAMDGNHLPNVRQYMEVFCAAAALRRPALLHERVLPGLDAPDSSRPYTIASLVLVALAFARHAPAAEQARALQPTLAALLPWYGTHNHTLRAFAQVALWELLEAFPPEHAAWGGEGWGGGAAGAALATLRRYLQSNGDCVKTRAATGRVGAAHPTLCAQPTAILGAAADALAGCPYEVGERFEGAPTPLVERITFFLDRLRDGTRREAAEKEGALLLAGGAGGGGGERLQKLDALQKKLDPSAGAQLSSQLGLEDPGDGEGGFETAAAAAPRHELILCASLVDKATNAGGLARTAEVFRLQRLVLGDAALSAQPAFRAMAVTAERLLPMQIVPPAALPSYLAARRADGYTLLGLEQTTGSQPLPAFAWPRRALLLLGGEGLGLPAELLPLLDACVEIPQPGASIRSLNVHVSAALAVYEYARQHAGALEAGG